MRTACMLAFPLVLVSLAATAAAQQAGQRKPPRAAQASASFPPALPQGRTVVTDTSPDFLKPAATLREGVAIAKTPPTIDFLYFPGQTYAGNPWSNWGDSTAAGGKYYASIGDHRAPAGNAFVFEYDPSAKELRKLADVQGTLKLPEGHYVPGKIHSRLELGSDGWLYFSTHRGSTRVTTDEYHYQGDWILRCRLGGGACEVVVHAPVPKHCLPTSVLDPQRLIFYGGTAPGSGDPDDIRFFAFDLAQKKMLYSGPDGPARCLLLASSTGAVYFNPGRGDEGPLLRFHPEKDTAPKKTGCRLGLRAATQETPQGTVYTVSNGQGGSEARLWAFDVRSERSEELGPAAVGRQNYITSLDADPSGRYLYYIPGAHGGADADGTPIVQYDVQTRQRKVLAFLHPFYRDKYGCALVGTYSSAVDPGGERLYITWNANRGSRAWDTCALTVVHIPASERGG